MTTTMMMTKKQRWQMMEWKPNGTSAPIMKMSNLIVLLGIFHRHLKKVAQTGGVCVCFAGTKVCETHANEYKDKRQQCREILMMPILTRETFYSAESVLFPSESVFIVLFFMHIHSWSVGRSFVCSPFLTFLLLTLLRHGSHLYI